MFRRFFQRNGRGQEPDPQESGSPLDKPGPEEVQRARKILQGMGGQHEDDGVHRMAIRTGKQELPDDPDEQAYAGDQGEHAEIARSALRAGDLRRSIYHLGLALTSDPAREEWLALLDQWIAAAGPRALDLVPLYDDQYFTTLQAAQFMMRQGNTPTHRMEVTPLVGKNYHARVAVHASILASQGKMKEAVNLLLQLIEVKPEIPYALWLPRWQSRAGFAEALEPEKIVPLTLRVMQKYSGTYVFSEQGRAEINSYLPLLREAYTALSKEQGSEKFLTTAYVYSMALRKTGAFEEAARISRALPATSYQAQVALAMVEDALGNTDASIAAYQRALAVEPNDVAVRNDLGLLFLAQGKLVEALAFFEESIRLDPGDPFEDAQAYIAYLNYLQGNRADAELERLKTLAQTQSAANRLLYTLHAPYLGRLPSPGEALINMMRGLKEKIAAGEVSLKAGSKFSVKLSSLEAPSARLAVERMLGSYGVSCTIAVEETLTPDPRQPLRPVEYQIWRYEGMDPIPAVPPPDPTVAERIAELARTPYALDRWYPLARALGRSLGEAALPSLLGVMVHPPAVPEGWDAWDWIIAVQIASTLTIAAIDSGWEDSRCKAALTSLIYGPLDWSGAAALIALAVLSRQDKRIHIEFDRVCRDLWHFGRGSAEWPHEHAMVFGLYFVSGYSDEAQKYIDEYFEEMRRERAQEEEK
jgi:tetratricopeptide (TPR) repeat protein